MSQRPVTLFGDGTVTVNVQNRPLKWLLEEIARQIREQVPAPASDQIAEGSACPGEQRQFRAGNRDLCTGP